MSEHTIKPSAKDDFPLPLLDTDIVTLHRAGVLSGKMSIVEFKAQLGVGIGGGGGGGGNVFTYQPGGTTDASALRWNDTDIDALVAAINAAAPQPRTLFVETSQAGLTPGQKIDVPGKIWKGRNLTIKSTLCDLNVFAGSFPQELNFLNGTLFLDCFPVLELCTFTGNNTSQPMLVCDAAEFCLVLVLFANIRNNGTQPIIDASAAIGTFLFAQNSDTQGGSGVVIDTGASSALAIVFYQGFSSYDTDIFKTTNVASPLIQNIDSNVVISGTYANWAGPVPTAGGFGRLGSQFSALAAQMIVDDSTMNLLSGAGETLQAILEALAPAVSSAKKRIFSSQLVLTSSNITTPQILISAANVPVGESVRILGWKIKVNGGAWTGLNTTSLKWEAISGGALIEINPATELETNALIENNVQTVGASAPRFVTYAVANGEIFAPTSDGLQIVGNILPGATPGNLQVTTFFTVDP